MVKLQAMKYRVFIRNGDAAVERALYEQLLASGYAMATSATDADLLLLEAVGSPAELCAGLREQGCAQPILLLGMAPDQARAVGADEGLVKPFRFGDLLRRLERISPKDNVAVGQFRLDANAR